MAEVARDLDVSPSVLRRWRQQLDADPAGAFVGHGQAVTDADELTRLRRELARVRQERDFLKKAAVDSTGRCNTRYGFLDWEGVAHGTDRTSWPLCDAEGGVVAPLEER
jgi:transposase-like protein